MVNDCEWNCWSFDSLAPAPSAPGLPVYVAQRPLAPFCETLGGTLRLTQTLYKSSAYAPVTFRNELEFTRNSKSVLISVKVKCLSAGSARSIGMYSLACASNVTVG